ncbi:DUF447 domain-containing protein [Methanococcoides sp. NM1]|uniref:DUF447 domain-containing protein n=1 Tax=Methanococcoides sp. NM1 TaxID=1201013 RepID=UPI0010839A48|nr:DUF447 domain-containing protein [Methanococcoides sp. NM1]
MAKIDLDTFGINEGISEMIVTTYQGWSPNAAPMGIIRKDNELLVRLFKGSTTYNNVLAEHRLVANLVYDPLLFVRTTFGNVDSSEFDVFTHDERSFAVLKEAVAWAVFECVDMKETSEALVAKLKPLHARMNKHVFRSVNRGFNLVIESCVHATRYELTNDEKYMRLIKAYSCTVNKCGGKAEKDAMKFLLNYLGEKK